MALGKISRVVSPFKVRTTFSYDQKGRIKSKGSEIAGKNYEFRFGYDAAGRLDTLTYPKIFSNQFAVNYSYSPHGQLTGLYDVNTKKAFWKLLDSDVTGNFGSNEFGNGTILTETPHPKYPYLLGSIEVRNLKAKLVQDLKYNYDKNYNVIERIDKVGMTSESFDYDAYNQLVNWKLKDAA